MLIRAESGLVLGNFVALAIGDSTENKNHYVLVEAVAQFPGNERLLIAGDRPPHGRPEAITEWLGVSGYVCLLEFRCDVAALLNVCDLFCLPSRNEGLSVLPIEAIGSGVRGCADVRFVCNRDACARAEHIVTIVEGGVPTVLSGLRTGRRSLGSSLRYRCLRASMGETLAGREAA